MMWKITAAAAAFGIALQGCAIAAPKEKLSPDTVLLENGHEKVTAQDFEAAMTRFPENLRDEARAYPSVIIKNIDAVFVNRVAADKAKELGLDQDPLVRARMKQVEESFLAQKYLDHLYETVKVPDLTLRAEEIYKADPTRYLDTATAELDDLIVSYNGRTREAAMERAREAEQRLRAGEDFVAVGTLYSDEQNFARSHGDLGLVHVKDLEEPIREAVEGLKAGDISKPIATKGAVHVLRVRQKTAAHQRSFADVKLLIMGEEEARLRTKATEDFLVGVRTDPANVIYKDRVEALRSDFDISKIGTLKQQAIERAQGQGSAPAR